MFKRNIVTATHGRIIIHVLTDNYQITIADRTGVGVERPIYADNFEVDINKRHVPEHLGHLRYVGYGYGATRKEAMNVAFECVRDQIFLKDSLWDTINIMKGCKL
jgi:hypothetical protein